MCPMLLNQDLLNIRRNSIQNKELMKMRNEHGNLIVVEKEKEGYQGIFVFDH
jgi:hypothetical protein